MSVNVYKRISAWLQNYQPIGSWLYFNCTPVELGTTSLNPSQGQRELKKYITGARDVELSFQIDMVKSYDTGTSDLNMDAFDEVLAFADWIESQNETKNYPDIGERLTIQRISVTSNVPRVSVSNTSPQLAKYTFSAKVVYKDESEVDIF